MINPLRRSPLTFYKPIWPAIFGLFISLILSVSLGAFILFVLMTPIAWSSFTIAERISATYTISFGFVRNILVDTIHGSLFQSLRGFDIIGRLTRSHFDVEFYPRWATAFRAGIIPTILFTFLVWFLTPQKRQARFIDGPRLIEGPYTTCKARRAIRHELREQHSIELAQNLPLPKERELRSFMLFGGQRSGKTVVLRSWLRQLIDANAKLIVHDTKGDMVASWPNNDFILLAPHDERSWGWDIGKDVVGQLETFEFAAALAPESEKEPQWGQGAQQILTGVLIALQRQHGTAWGWTELCSALHQNPASLYQMAISYYPMAAKFLALDAGEFTRTSASYVTTLMAPVARLIQPLAAAWGDLHPAYRISLKDWLSDDYRGPKTLILQRMPAFAETSRLWISAAIESMVAVTGGGNFSDSKTRRIWFILDEFPQLGKIKSLFNVPATHASKGVTLVLAFQSLGQVKEAYGAEAISNLGQLIGTKVIFRVQGEDASYVSDKLIGKWRYRAPNHNSKRKPGSWFADNTNAWQDKEENLVLPFYFSELKPHTLGVDGLILGLDGGNVYRLSWRYEKWPEQRPGHIAAQWIYDLTHKV